MTLSLSDLPASARQIAEVIGIPDTVKLCRQLFRGYHKMLYVPTVDHMQQAHEIAVAIGFIQALRLAAHFGGDTIYLPSPSFEKRAAIWADYMANMTPTEIAKKHHITERHARRITAEERPKYNHADHCRQIAKISTPAKAASARRYGTLGGNKKNTMIREILHRLKGEPRTPYGALLTSIHSFKPRLMLLLTESEGREITIERAVELMVPCLPAEMTVKYGDNASLMILKPAKNALQQEPLLIRVETPLTPKAMSQNSVVISMLEALAVSALIDKMGTMSGQPKPVEARN